MSIRVCVAVKDTAARVFGQPFFVQAVAQAVRSLRDEVNSSAKDSDISRHPDDFELYQIGAFDDDDGTFRPATDGAGVAVPVLICRAKDLKEQV